MLGLPSLAREGGECWPSQSVERRSRASCCSRRYMLVSLSLSTPCSTDSSDHHDRQACLRQESVRRTRSSCPSQHIVGQSDLGDRTMMSRRSFSTTTRGQLKSSHHGISVEVIFLEYHDAVADLLVECRDSVNGIYGLRNSLGLSPCPPSHSRGDSRCTTTHPRSLNVCPFHFKTPIQPRATTARWRP